MSEFKATKSSSAWVEAIKETTEIRTEWDSCILCVCMCCSYSSRRRFSKRTKEGEGKKEKEKEKDKAKSRRTEAAMDYGGAERAHELGKAGKSITFKYAGGCRNASPLPWPPGFDLLEDTTAPRASPTPSPHVRANNNRATLCTSPRKSGGVCSFFFAGLARALVITRTGKSMVVADKLSPATPARRL